MVAVTPKGLVPKDYAGSELQASAYAAGYAAGIAYMTLEQRLRTDYATEITAAMAEATPGVVMFTQQITEIVGESTYLASVGYHTGLEVIALSGTKPGALAATLNVSPKKGFHLDCDPVTTKTWTGTPVP